MSDERQAEDTPRDEQPSETRPGHDPRPVSDARLREEVSREEVEGYRKQADEAHANWFSVMNNPYGKD